MASPAAAGFPLVAGAVDELLRDQMGTDSFAEKGLDLIHGPGLQQGDERHKGWELTLQAGENMGLVSRPQN